MVLIYSEHKSSVYKLEPERLGTETLETMPEKNVSFK